MNIFAHMTVIRLTKEFSFEAAHALDGYDGPCREIHGHSYRLFVTVKGCPAAGEGDPKCGMVMDFGVLKRIVNEEIVSHWTTSRPARICSAISPAAFRADCRRAWSCIRSACMKPRLRLPSGLPKITGKVSHSEHMPYALRSVRAVRRHPCETIIDATSYI